MEFRELLVGLVLVWVAAKVAGEGMERIGQTAVLGELLAGVLIGPGGLGLVHESDALHALAELGVLILLFEVGLESDLNQLLRAGAQATLVAVVGVVLPLALGFGVMRWFGPSALVAVFVGATLTATSVGITARVFADLGRLQDAAARVVLGAAVVDDILGLIILAVVDLAFVKWRFLDNLKMTKQEVKDEHKNSEGDPAVKGKQKQKQFQMARRRRRQIIPTADVVVTNPTHYAVALKYDRFNMAAPVVLFKGVEDVKKGAKLSQVFRQYGHVYPFVVTQMVEVGEETGKTAEVFSKLADFYEEEVGAMTKNLASVIEPVLMLIIGGVVGFFAIAIITPMYSMVQSVQ